jgi:hypothetical protein
MEKMKKLKLNIQLFAEEDTAGTIPTGEPVATETEKSVENDTPSFTDLLKNPDYQREFDKLVNKSISTAKTNWKKDYDAKLEKERSEAEKLAQMDAEQKIQYELDKAKAEKEALQSELNAINLYKTASNIATEKELPIGYLDLVDFTKESAETITEKIDKLQELRQRDLETYLNSKLKQSTPQEKKDNDKAIDPYVEGFLSEL